MSGQQYPPVPESRPENRPENQPENRPENPPGQAPGWGAPPPSAGGWGGSGQGNSRQGANGGAATGAAAAGRGVLWTRKRGLMAGGAAILLVVVAGAAGYALSSATAGAASPGLTGAGQNGARGNIPGGAQGTVPNGARGGQGGPGNFAADALGGGIAAALHTEYVVSENGSYVTKVSQLGTVTDASAGSVTVRSDDGFSRTYTLGSNVTVSNPPQRRQQAGGTQGGGTQPGGAQSGGATTGGLTVADIVTGATVRIVAGKDGANFSAETVQLVASSAAGTSN